MLLPHLSRPAMPVRAPLLVYLHGAGEVGGDTEQQVRKFGPWADVLHDPTGAYGPDTAAAIGRFHVLGFHLPAGDWDGDALAAELAAWLTARPEIDPAQLHLTGISRGGRGVLRLAATLLREGRPVASVAAFCPAGGAGSFGEPDIALLRRVPVWLFHCPEDPVVPFAGSAELHRRIGSATSRLRIVHGSELADPAAAHDCWTSFYAHPDFYRWLEGPATDPADWPHLRARRA